MSCIYTGQQSIDRQNDNNTLCFTAYTSTSAIYVLITEFIHKIIPQQRNNAEAEVKHQATSLCLKWRLDVKL